MDKDTVVTEGEGWSFNGDPDSIERDLEEQFGDSLMDIPELEADDEICTIQEVFGYFGPEL